MVKKMNWIVFALTVGGIFLSSCASSQVRSNVGLTQIWQLTPYLTRTPPASPLPTKLVESKTLTPKPAPIPTPITHIVKRGEDMGGIAYAFKITLKALMDANPNVTPDAMSVGTVLTIPLPGEAVQPQGGSIPPPEGILAGQPVCYRTTEGGLICFTQVKNTTDTAIGNVKAIIHSFDQNGLPLVSVAAFSLLDIIPAGESMPLLGYFSPGIPDGYKISAELTNGTRLEGDTVFPKIEIKNQQVVILSDGTSAEVSGDLNIQWKGVLSARIQVAAIAYDETDKIVGARRWESSVVKTQVKSVPFAVRVFAQEWRIKRIAVLVQSTP